MRIVIDNIDLYTTYGIMLVSHEGLLDPLKTKKRQSHNWSDEHGNDIDLSTAFYEERQITLNLRLAGVTKADFVAFLTNFGKFVTASGLRILKHPQITRPYFVYAPEGASVKKETLWNDTLMIATFSLKLFEPFPIGRYFSTNQSSLSTVTITITCTKAMVIHWGDGTTTTTVQGTAIVSTKNYTVTRNPYYIQIVGDITSISSLTKSANTTEITWF
jgi:hypothetical protein